MSKNRFRGKIQVFNLHSKEKKISISLFRFNDFFTMDASNETLSSVNKTSKNKEKNGGGRPLGQIWVHFDRILTETPGKFGAVCKYCTNNWKRAEIPALEEHLASHCPNVSISIIREYVQKVITREDTLKKRKLESGQTTISSFHDSTEIPNARVNRINRSLGRFFVACGVSFRIVEHPFFIDLVKELNAAYNPPTREHLSGRILERELCHVNDNIERDIMNHFGLTLGK